MPFPFLALAISIGFTILGQLLAPRPKNKPTGLDEFQVPTATEDRPKPYWVGTVRHKSPNCVWYGDYSTKAIKTGGLMTFGMTTVVGYKYYLGYNLNLGWGQMDAITRIAMNDKEAWTGSVSTGNITINKPELFGGQKSGGNGGFQGTVVVYNGNGSQTADPYMVAQSGATPAYKKDVHLVVKGLSSGGAYVGNSASLPEMSFDLRRCPNQLAVTGSKHIIDTHDANPVCALYEFMTRPNNEFGGGFAEAQFDLDNWREAAETVYAEGLGISRMFDSAADVESVINDYLQLIDAVINVNMLTGKLEIALARDDYDPDTILELGDDDVLEVVTYKRGTWTTTYNEVKMSYIDRTAEFASIPIAAQDGANSAGQAEIRSNTVQIFGLSNPTTANKVLYRELRVVSTPLATLTIRCNRNGFQLTGGSVFRWVGTQYGIAGMIFRVSEVDAGSLTSGAIEVKCVQDIFALGATVYDPPQPTTWTAPTTTKTNIATARVIEQPYFFHQTANHRILSMAAKANGAQLAYDLYTKESTGTNYTQRQTEVMYTPTGTLSLAYTSTAYNVSSALKVTPGTGMTDLPTPVEPADIASGQGGLLIINDEILAYESYTIDGSGNYVFNGVWGGLLDTLLATHALGDRVWFIAEGCGLDTTNYAAGATVNTKMASLASDGAVDLASCTVFSI